MRRFVTPEWLEVPWSIRDVLVLIAAWFGAQSLLGVGLGAARHLNPALNAFVTGAARGDIGPSFVLTLAGVVIGFVLVWLFLRRYHVGWSVVGWRKVSIWRTVLYLVVIFLSFLTLSILAMTLAQMFVPGFNANQPQTNEFTKGAASNRSLALVALVLLPPVFEETIFRGFIFPAIAKRAGVMWGALISSLIFGIAHGQPNLFVYTTILGLFLCFMYIRLKSIVPGILLHMINNYLAFLALSQK